MELLQSCAETDIEPGCIPWTYVGLFYKDDFLKKFLKCYKEIRGAAAVGEDTLDVYAPDSLCVKQS